MSDPNIILTRVTEVHPHDHFFRGVFSSPENALGILRAVLQLQGLESDLLFRVQLAGKDARIYLLLEHQSTVHPLMPFRLLRYVVRIWERWLRDHEDARTLPAVIPMVLFHGPAPWSGPTRLGQLLDLPEELRDVVGRYVPTLEFLLDDLAARDSADLEARRASVLARLALVWMKAAFDGTDPFELLDRMRPLIEELVRTTAGREGFAMILSYTQYVHEIDPHAILEHVRRTFGPEASEAAMTGAQRLIEEGMAKGIAKGREQALRQILSQQLETRFGPLSDQARERLATASVDHLNRWVVRVVSARTLDEVLATN